MTVEEYQKKVLDLTAELLGTVIFSPHYPFRMQITLPHQPLCGMHLSIGFIKDIGDYDVNDA
jgi:hypothetical protein